MAEQLTVGPDCQLLDASKIDWYNDPDDVHPIQPQHSMVLNYYSLVTAK